MVNTVRVLLLSKLFGYLCRRIICCPSVLRQRSRISRNPYDSLRIPTNIVVYRTQGSNTPGVVQESHGSGVTIIASVSSYRSLDGDASYRVCYPLAIPLVTLSSRISSKLLGERLLREWRDSNFGDDNSRPSGKTFPRKISEEMR